MDGANSSSWPVGTAKQTAAVDSVAVLGARQGLAPKGSLPSQKSVRPAVPGETLAPACSRRIETFPKPARQTAATSPSQKNARNKVIVRSAQLERLSYRA